MDMLSDLPTEVIFKIITYLNYRDWKTITDLNRWWRNQIGNSKSLHNQMQSYIEKCCGNRKWTLIKELDIPIRFRIKRMSAMAQLHTYLERNNIKKVHKRHNGQKRTKMNSFTFYIWKKHCINYNEWKHLGMNDTTEDRFIALYGGIWQLLQPEEKRILKYEAKLFASTRLCLPFE